MSIASLPLRARAELERRRRLNQVAHTPAKAPRLLTALEWSERNATIVHPTHGRIPFCAYPYQSEFLNSYHVPRRLVLKARQIGFSQTFAIEGLYCATEEFSEATVLLVSRSQDLAVNLLRYCYQAYSNLRNAPPLIKSNESEMGFGNGKYVSGGHYQGSGHGSRIKSIPANRSTGRGFAANRVYLDEFAYAEYAEDIYQSISPTVSQGGYLTAGSTANGIHNLFYRLWIEQNDFKKYRVPWHECPAYYTPQERVAGILPEESAWYKAERPKYLDNQWASEYDCNFTLSGGGLIYERFNRDAHVRARSPSEFKYWVLAIDEGYTNPAVILLVGVDSDGRLHVVREFYERGKLQKEVIEVARAWALEKHIVVAAVDAAAAGLVADLRDCGVPAQAAKGRVLDGITIVQSLLRIQGDNRARLTVDPSCVNVIREFETYVWRDGKDEPVKENDHALDALRYLCNWLYAEREIERVVYQASHIGSY